MRRKLRAFIVGATVLFDVSASHALNSDSRNFAFWCTLPESSIEGALLNSYIDGTVDTLLYAYEISKSRRRFCLPPTANRAMLANAFCSFIRRNPNLVEYLAAQTIERAMEQTFPCRQN